MPIARVRSGTLNDAEKTINFIRGLMRLCLCYIYTLLAARLHATLSCCYNIHKINILVFESLQLMYLLIITLLEMN